ncbi:hypothetical protein Msi02_74260 [Microbispora siamensis]|uniref:Uncharacterized protein n=1 Tax=Microbispora siamensis TaxID=564413 RepID=A0ABQ4GYT0_9ACTN|nr:hypothetical protein Msi02_74260 [Microbispora siamensis]
MMTAGDRGEDRAPPLCADPVGLDTYGAPGRTGSAIVRLLKGLEEALGSKK